MVLPLDGVSGMAMMSRKGDVDHDLLSIRRMVMNATRSATFLMLGLKLMESLLRHSRKVGVDLVDEAACL